MEPEELESGQGDPVTGIDRWLVGIGVAILALPKTFSTLVANPARLYGLLSANRDDKDGSSSLGPGLFFVLSLLAFVVVMRLVASGAESSELQGVEDQVTTGAGYATGYALAKFVSTLESRLASGNLWSAVVTVVPVYGFVVALALFNRLLVGIANARWTTAQAMGASLYMVGGIIVWLAMIVLVGAILSPVIPSALVAISGALLLLTGICLTAVQAYAFASRAGGVGDYRLGLASASMPLIIIGLMAVTIIGLM